MDESNLNLVRNRTAALTDCVTKNEYPEASTQCSKRPERRVPGLEFGHKQPYATRFPGCGLPGIPGTFVPLQRHALSSRACDRHRLRILYFLTFHAFPLSMICRQTANHQHTLHNWC